MDRTDEEPYSSDGASGTGCGIFRSMDNGASWKLSIVDSNGNSGNGALALLASGSYLYASIGNLGIMRSSDSGSTWANASFGLTTNSITCFASDGAILFAGSDDQGVFLSSDSGKTWNSMKFNQWGIRGIAITNSRIFACLEDDQAPPNSGGGIYVVKIGDTNWSLAGLQGQSVSTIVSFGDEIFAGTRDSGVFRSADSGRSWVPINSGLPRVAVQSIFSFDSMLFAGTWGAGIFQSTDHGNSWTSDNDGLSDHFVECLTSNGVDLLAGTIGVGIYRSTDSGTSWHVITNNASVVENLGSLVFDSAEIFAASGGSGIFRSSDAGQSWQPIDNGLPGLGSASSGILGVVGHTLLLGDSYYGVFRSTDSGVSWSPTSVNNGIEALVVSGSNVFATDGGSHVYLSRDSGRSWVTLGELQYPDFIVADGANLFVRTAYQGIFHSTDSGRSWFPFSIGQAQYKYFDAMTIADSEIFAIVGSMVFKSTNSGGSWLEIDSGSVYDVQSLEAAGTSFFAGSQLGGIFFSNDGGISWKSVNSGLLDSNIGPIIIDDSVVFAGSASTGVWRRPLSEMISSAAVKEVPSTNQISAQAYPDPFLSKTMIHFTAAEPGFARVTIVNLVGKEVAQLYFGDISAGDHSFTWDAANVPAGTYFCVIQSSDGRQVVSVRRE